ncbi:MAG: PAS domain S-box protein [Bryobacteraceae bacterium]|nr:PAS domain S-box protein [Bryobacteraceae bacterium]
MESRIRRLRGTRPLLLGLAAACAGVAIRVALDTTLSNLPFIAFVVPVLVAAVAGGFGAGLLATAISIVAGWFCFVAPRYTFFKGSPDDALRLTVFLLSGALISWLAGRLRDSQLNARRSEWRFRNTFENAAVGMAHTTLDGAWIVVNKKLCDITGCDQEGLVKDPLPAHLDPQSAGEWQTAVRDLEFGRISSYSVETRWRCSEDRWIWVNLTAAVSPGEDGIPESLVVVVEDITTRKHASQALAASEQRLALALAAGRLGVWDWDIESGRVEWSGGLAALSGRTEPQAPATFAAFLDIVHPEDRLRVESAVQRALEHDELYDVEFRTIWPDGSLHWIARKGSVVRDRSGRPTRMIGVGADITARKTAEQELQKAKRQVEDILSSITESFIALDREWRFTYVNRRVVERGGKSREELIGRSIWDVFPEAATSRLWHEYHHVMEKREPRCFETGSPLPTISNHYEVHAYPTDEGMCAYVLDITDRKRAESALAEREAFFRTLGDAVPDFVWVSDASGRSLYVNQRWYQYTGASLSRIAQRGWNWFYHPDDAAAVEQSWAEARLTGSLFEVEFRCRRHDGVYRWFMARAVPVIDEQGNVQQWVGTSTDIHDLKEAETKLRRYNQELEQFAFAAAHDLQEPLRNVTIYSELLARRLDGVLDAPSRELFEHIRAGGSRMTILVRDLLEFARVVNDGAPSTPIDANEAARQALDAVSQLAQQTNAQVSVEPLPQVQVFAPHLVQLFQNLIGNALKYRSPDRAPVIRVSALRNGSEWIFSVEDNGMGIEAAYHDRVFGVFKRLHGRDVQGTGIGLAIAKRVVEHYGGRIWVESDGATGSAFRFTLPAAPASTATAS